MTPAGECLHRARLLSAIARRYVDVVDVALLLGYPTLTVVLSPAAAAVVAGAKEERHDA